MFQHYSIWANSLKVISEGFKLSIFWTLWIDGQLPSSIDNPLKCTLIKQCHIDCSILAMQYWLCFIDGHVSESILNKNSKKKYKKKNSFLKIAVRYDIQSSRIFPSVNLPIYAYQLTVWTQKCIIEQKSQYYIILKF